MIVYKVGRYTFSADLRRYSKQVGQEGNYTLGFCTVEYLPKGNSLYHPEPKLIDSNKPYDIIEFDPKAKINGSLAIQCEPDKHNATQAEEISWIAIQIDAPDGDLDGLIRRIAAEGGVELNEQILVFFHHLPYIRPMLDLFCHTAVSCINLSRSDQLAI